MELFWEPIPALHYTDTSGGTFCAGQLDDSYCWFRWFSHPDADSQNHASALVTALFPVLISIWNSHWSSHLIWFRCSPTVWSLSLNRWKWRRKWTTQHLCAWRCNFPQSCSCSKEQHLQQHLCEFSGAWPCGSVWHSIEWACIWDVEKTEQGALIKIALGHEYLCKSLWAQLSPKLWNYLPIWPISIRQQPCHGTFHLHQLLPSV